MYLDKDIPVISVNIYLAENTIQVILKTDITQKCNLNPISFS